MNVTFIFSEFSLHNQIIEDYARSRPDDKISIVKVSLVVRGKNRFKTAEAILPKLPNRFVIGKLIEFISLGLITFVPKFLKRGAVFRRLSRIADLLSAPYIKVDDINSAEAFDFIKAQSPDIIYSLFHQIVREPLISLPKFAFVNAHPGLLPDFKGIQPYLWQLSKGEKRSGATLHLIENAGIDTGRILAQGSFCHLDGISVQLNYYLTCRLISSMLPELSQFFLGGKIQPEAQVESSAKESYFKWPTSQAIDDLYSRGHRLISIKQLWGILSGKYDDFHGDVKYYLKVDSL